MSRTRASARQAGARFERVVADWLAANVAFPLQIRDNGLREAESRANGIRPLTHSSGTSREGLGMEPTRRGFHQRPCVGCGQLTPPQSGRSGQPRKWCSVECRSKRPERAPRFKGLATRLSAKLARSDSGCLEFTGYRNAGGYGVIRGDDGRTLLAHRAAWILRYGPIEAGLDIRHRCDNPPCCDTEHLLLGTHVENMRDRDERGRTLQGERFSRAKLTDAQVRSIRAALTAGESHAVIAARFGISKTHVSGIRNNKTRRSA